MLFAGHRTSQAMRLDEDSVRQSSGANSWLARGTGRERKHAFIRSILIGFWLQL